MSLQEARCGSGGSGVWVVGSEPMYLTGGSLRGWGRGEGRWRGGVEEGEGGGVVEVGLLGPGVAEEAGGGDGMELQ